MNRTETRDRALQAQLDRLVGGDLPESERTTLLAWLDEDATRWRTCGLAFLEAQMWQEAAAIEPRVGHTAANSPPPLVAPARPATSRDGWRVSAFALTAAVALAFLIGVVCAQWLPNAARPQQPQLAEQSVLPQITAAAKPLIATVPVKTNLETAEPLLLQLPISSEPGQDLAANSSISPYERQQLERRGFEVLEELRFLPARLPDGRQIMVPVNKVQLKYKGTPVS